MLNSIFAPAMANIGRIHGHHHDRITHAHDNEDEGLDSVDDDQVGTRQATATKLPAPVGAVNKKVVAGMVYGEMVAAGKPRKEVIQAMVDRANLTVNGASTYYQNFKSGQWDYKPSSKTKTEVAAPEPIKVDFDSMSVPQLLVYYNEHALIKLSGFVSREDALNMIEKYCK